MITPELQEIDILLSQLRGGDFGRDNRFAADSKQRIPEALARASLPEAYLKDLISEGRNARQKSPFSEADETFFSPIEATAELELTLRKLKPYFTRHFNLGFVSGSLAYSPFVKMRASSDIDLTLVAAKFDPRIASKLPFENVEEIENAMDSTKFDDTAQVCVRTVYLGKQVAIHFTPMRWYNSVSSLRIADGSTQHRVRRITERPERGIFPGRYDFRGEEHIWTSRTGTEGDLYFIDQNDFEVDSDGRYVNGVLIDMLSISRFYFGDHDLFTQNRLKLLSRLSGRFHEEMRSGLLPRSAKFTNIFHCHSAFAGFFEADLAWCN